MGRYLGIDVGSKVVSAVVLEIGYRKLGIVATREVAVDSMPSLEEAVRAAASPLLEHIDGMAAAVDGDVTVGDGLDAGDFGTITRDDGTTQLTVARQPLYRYTPDGEPGDTNGQGVGDVWFAVGPDGEAVS